MCKWEFGVTHSGKIEIMYTFMCKWEWLARSVDNTFSHSLIKTTNNEAGCTNYNHSLSAFMLECGTT